MDAIIADIIIVVAAVVLLAAIATTAYSVQRSMRVNRTPKVENNIPIRLISLLTVALVAVVALPSMLFGSLTDMCIITVVVLLLIASGAVIFGKILTARLRKRV